MIEKEDILGYACKIEIEQQKERLLVIAKYAKEHISVMAQGTGSTDVVPIEVENIPLVIAFLEQITGAGWLNVEEGLLPEPGEEVIGFHLSWVNEDCNPNGTCLCSIDDDGVWTVAMWCMQHDEYHTRRTDEKATGEETLKLPPTQWRAKPSKPQPIFENGYYFKRDK